MQNNLFIGRLAGDVELRATGAGPLASLVLIANEYAGKDEDGENRERTVALRFTAFNHQALVLADNTTKGKKLAVKYRIENNNYVSGENNEMRYDFNFVITDFEFCD